MASGADGAASDGKPGEGRSGPPGRLRDVLAGAEPVEPLVDADRRLMEGVRDQLAAGQVESLLSLEQASRALQRRTKDVEATTLVAADQAEALLRGLPDVVERSAQSTATRLGSTLEVLLERLSQQAQAAVDQIDAAGTHTAGTIVEAGLGLDRRTDAVWVQLLALSARLAEDSDAAVARAQAASREAEQALASALDLGAHEVVRRLDEASAAAAAALQEATAVCERTAERAQVRLEAAADRADAASLDAEQRMSQIMAQGVADVRATLDGEFRLAAQRVQAAGESAGQSVERATGTLLMALATEREHWQRIGRDVGEALLHQLTVEAERLHQGASTFQIDFGVLLERWQGQEVRRDARTDARVGRLVDRAQTLIAEATGRLGTVADQLERRDEALESRRAHEFVRVLDDVLSRAGVRGRGLRGRVLGALDKERVEASAAAPVRLPAPVEPAAAKEPPRPRPAKRPPAAKAAAKATAKATGKAVATSPAPATPSPAKRRPAARREAVAAERPGPTPTRRRTKPAEENDA